MTGIGFRFGLALMTYAIRRADIVSMDLEIKV